MFQTLCRFGSPSLRRVRNSPGIVGNQSEKHLVVANVDVGMMSGGFGDGRHPVHKRHRLNEVLECPFPDEFSTFQLPLWVVFKTSSISAAVNALAMSNTSRLRC